MRKIIPGLLLASVFLLILTQVKIEKADTKVGSIALSHIRILTLEARSAFVQDLASGEVLYEKNPDVLMPLASVTKLITAEIAFQNLSLSEMYDLLQRMLVYSSNEAAEELAEKVGRGFFPEKGESGTVLSARERFIKNMNAWAQEIGLRSALFINPSGVDEDIGVNGGYASARELAMVIRHIYEYHPEILTISSSLYSRERTQSGVKVVPNTNELISEIINISGSKTGFTDISGGNLVVVFEPKLLRPTVAVVLGSGKEGRFVDMQKIVEALWKNL